MSLGLQELEWHKLFLRKLEGPKEHRPHPSPLQQPLAAWLSYVLSRSCFSLLIAGCGSPRHSSKWRSYFIVAGVSQAPPCS
ncbi:hypothetical protein SRHO_G00269990 [Serrasalmus rhombeus]